LRNGTLSRCAWALTGLLALAWLGFEDRGLAAVTLVAWMISLSSLMTARARRSSLAESGPSGMRWWILAGAAAGALVGPIVAALILLKTGLHAHPTPDFSTAQIISVLARIPL
jgi:hypothetical protein